MKKVTYVLLLLVTFVGIAQAQEQTHDRTAIYGAFTSVNADYGIGSLRGLTAGGEVTVFGYEGVKLGIAGESMFLFSNGDRFTTVQGGPKIGVKLFHNRLNPYVEALFGAAIYEGNHPHSNAVGVGFDVNITSRVFVRGAYHRQSVDGFPPFYRTTFGVGGRF